MATKMKKIPKSIWDRHRDTILSLYLTSDLTVEELVRTMDEDHGFSASLSQYEAQFRIWNARKNIRREEWEVILEKIDHLASQGIQSRVVISGHTVSDSRIQRARRHCKSGHPPRKRKRTEPDLGDESNDFDASHVVIEIQGQDGKWSSYTRTASKETTSRPDQNQRLERNDNDIGVMHGFSTDSRYPTTIEPLDIVNMSPWLPTSQIPNLISENWLSASEGQDLLQASNMSLVSPGSLVPRTPIHHESDMNISSQILELASSPFQLDDSTLFPYGELYLKDLPFEKFEQKLLSKGLNLVTCPSPMQDCGILSGPHMLVTLFITEAAAAMTNINGNSLDENVYRAVSTLRTLYTIFPRCREAHENDTMVRSTYEISEVELHRLLLYSTANGFTGMGDIPIETVLRVLNRNNNITQLLSRLFREIPGQVAKGLAENLFRAAIESSDQLATRFLLKTSLVDVNNTLCFTGDIKCTPIERAAELGELKVVQELLRFDSHLNRTLSPKTQHYMKRYSGVLRLLINALCPSQRRELSHITFTSEYLDTVDALIRAGAEVSN
ncbi:hypothetical protein AAE478_004411 [Parahypoxylon ruwenzoriense]